jgi:membrane protein DedA with SNARE-associated domain
VDPITQLLGLFEGLPSWLAYLVLGMGSALENVFPPVPADTFVILGAFLAARGGLVSAPTVFWVTWVANSVAAGAVYGAGRRYGESFFGSGVGRYLLNPHQMERMRGFYDRWGLWAIFFTRFLPGVRAVVPVFAGVTRQAAPRVLLPIVVASGIWHAFLVVAGVGAGQNLEAVVARVRGLNGWLIGFALLVTMAVAVWWIRTRRGGARSADE